MGRFLGLPEGLETDDEDENHVGLAGPRLVLWFVCNLILPQNGIPPKCCSLAFCGNVTVLW